LDGANWIELRIRRSPHIGDLVAAIELSRLFRDYDIVHAHSSKAGAVARVAARLSGKCAQQKLIFIPHGWSWSVGGPLAGGYRVFERYMATSCARIIAVSEREFDAGRRVLGPDTSLQVIENSVDTRRWHPDGPAATRADAPLVVCVGRLTMQKGQDRLIRALAEMSTGDVRLRLVGDGECRGMLERLAVELGVEDRIEFLGAGDPSPHYRAADVVAVPSRWEGLSLVLLEAMASGSAIVATPDGSSGLLSSVGIEVAGGCESDVVRGLADSLDLLMNDEPLRLRLGNAARQLAEDCYDHTVWAAKYCELWANVVQQIR
jgi:glycosyltransferase involved in cell wall biosynthesis